MTHPLRRTYPSRCLTRMHCLFVFLASAIISLEFREPARAQQKEEYVPPKTYLCRRAVPVKDSSAPSITIDGQLDEPAWQAAEWTDEFVDIEGDVRPRPRFATCVKMLWDDHYFYLGADLEEPHVWGTLDQHDSVIFHDNDFELFIDPDGDSHHYGEFEINALGTGWDLRLLKPYKDGGKADDGWEIRGLQSAVKVHGTLNNPHDVDDGWTIEIAVPWTIVASLSDRSVPIRMARRNGSVFESYEEDPPGASNNGNKAVAPDTPPPAAIVSGAPRDGDQWRVNFSRVQWQHEIVGDRYQKVANRREDNWVWSPQWVIDMHRPETWGYVQFSSTISGNAVFRVDSAGPAKHILHRIYYAERSFHGEHHRFTDKLDELNLTELEHESFVGSPTIDIGNDNTFRATALVRLAGGKLERWHIREDARIWCDSEP